MPIFFYLFATVLYLIGSVSIFTLVYDDNTTEASYIRKYRILKAFVFFAWPLFILFCTIYVLLCGLIYSLKQVFTKEQ